MEPRVTIERPVERHIENRNGHANPAGTLKDEMVLIIAPLSQDAHAMADLLEQHGFQVRICNDPLECLDQMTTGSGALLITEEVLEMPRAESLFEGLKSQPPWSELPLIVLTRGGESRLTRLIDQAADSAGSITLLERPLGSITLVRAVEASLKSRRRQYRVRDLILEQERIQQALHAAREELLKHSATLEKTVEERTAKLRETVNELEAFSYSVAHDLRAPLRAMNSYAQLVRELYANCLDESGRDYLGRISTSAERLDLLIRDVLNYTQIVRAPAPSRPVDMDKLVRGIIQSYPNFQPPHAEIRIEGTLPKVLGYEGFLTQCVSNLLGNAVKFVRPGELPRVRIFAQMKRDDFVRVWFEDNGIGIASKNHDRIFRMFERLHPAGEYEGTGIGLTIVKKAVERMGGRVGFESEVGKGSEFWIELPKAGD